MKKEKIAISINQPILNMIDAIVQEEKIRSRSQVIETLLTQSLTQQAVSHAVILIRGKDAKLLLKKAHQKTVLEEQIEWLISHGIEKPILIIGQNEILPEIKKLCAKLNTKIIIDKKESGTAQALRLVEAEISKQFLVVLGDTLNYCNLTKMMLFHAKNKKIATVGLISTAQPKNYSKVELEGDRIVAFRKEGSNSHIIDAGIYLFKPTIFEYLEGKNFLDRDVFPDLCQTNEIKGYFTQGEYRHLGQ